MKPWEIIAKLESDNSRLYKEAVIDDAAVEENNEFFEGCRLALDSMITFGVKKVPLRNGVDAPGGGIDWSTFTLAITGFINREITGNTARDMIAEMMKNSTNAQWNDWYRRILIKDLRCGVSEKTINNVVGKKYLNYAIPVFSCQLAHDASNDDRKLTGKKMIECKLDGVRVITIVYPDGRVDQFSRNGKELLNFQKIKDQIAGVRNGSFKVPMVLDGEVMSSSFQDLMKQIHRKENVNANDAILNLFDIIPLENFETGRYDLEQKTRTEYLTQWYEDNASRLANVNVLSNAIVDLNTDEGNKLFKMYNKSAIENGYEGIMLKDPSAPYECKRTNNWLKIKPFIEVSLEVMNVEEGTGKYCGSLGALVCSGHDEGKHITVNVGSGFSDLDRDQFWRSRDTAIGQIVEVRADAITKNQDGTYSLRFPRFLRFRGFTKGEKL